MFRIAKGRTDARLRMALDAARMVAWEWTAADGLLHVSENAAELFGLPPGTTLIDIKQGLALIHPDDLASYQETYRKAVAELGSYRIHYRLVRPLDGGVIWMEERGQAVAAAGSDGVRLFGVVMDITDRKRAEEEVQEARSRLESTLAAGEIGTWEYDVVENIVRADRNLARMFGVTSDEAAGGPLDVYVKAIHPDDRERVGKAIRQALESNAAYEEEYRILSPNGSIRWVVARGRVEYTASGSMLRMPGVVVDITARKQAEEENALLVTASENQRRIYETVLSSTPDFNYVFDLGGRFTYVNSALLTLLQKELDETVGRNFFDLGYPTELAERLEKQIQQVIDTKGPVRDETPYGSHRGERQYEYIFVPVIGTTGEVEAVAGSTRDITERKEAENKLRQSEERYRTLFNSMDEGFCVIDIIYDDSRNPIDYRYLEINPAFIEQTGMTDAIGKRVRELAPNLKSYWFEAFDSVARTHIPVRLENAAKEFGDRWYDVYAFPIRDGDSSKVALLFYDISHRKRAEQERERLVEQLRDADRRKDEFLAMLAHELRNPLGVISNGVQLVQTVQRPELLIQLRELIEHQVVHLTHLIDDLLDVSRITQGKIKLKKKTVDLAAIVGRAAELVRPVVQENQHELTIDLPDRPVQFVADPTRTEQILGNLLTNAAKYSPSRGSIHLSATVEEDQIVFRIRDEGDGISAEMLPKIFGLFTQVDATIDRSRGGLGIGLTLVKSLVEMHDGVVTAASEGRDKGSEFTVRLPIGQPKGEEESSAAPTRPKPQETTGKILVVDDNVETVRLTARMLKHHGYEVETAHDGNDAVELARDFQPNVVLLDIGLPGLNGYEVAAMLRQDDCCKAARLVAISGYGEQQSRERSREAGFDHHLTKPVSFDQLKDILSSLDQS